MAMRTTIPGVRDYYTFPPAPNAVVVDMFLREKGIDATALERWVDLPNGDNRNEECLRMNPQGGLPWFVLESGTVVAETIAMCEYVEEVLPEPVLVGANAEERAAVRAWQRRLEEHYVYPAFYGHRNWCASKDCPDDHFMKDFFSQRMTAKHGANIIPHAWKDLVQWARNRILWLERVKQQEAEEQGKATDYICGDRYTIVDIQVYATMWFFTEFPPPQKILQDLEGQLPWVQAWYDRVSARPCTVAAKEYRLVSEAKDPSKKPQKAPAAAAPPAAAMPPAMAEGKSREELLLQLLDPSGKNKINDGSPPLSKPTFDVTDKCIVVTGATSGLGRGIALCLAAAGARGILVHGTSEDRGHEVVSAIKLLAPECTAVFHQADLLGAEACRGVVPAAVAALGRVDGVVNSAALCFPRGTLEDTTVELWDTMMNLNARATFLVNQAAVEHMKANGIHGSIVNVASIAAQGGAPWIMAYSASKAAVVSMTKTNAVELRPHRIRVNAINMGWCLTDKEDAGQRAWRGEDWLGKAEAQHPFGRLMRPIDVAGTVGHLLSDAAAMLTGSVIDFAPELITGAYE